MKKIISLLILMAVPVLSWGASSTYPLMEMEPDLHDKASMQRGMATYMNYCFACHSLQYQRYERTADDLGIPHDLMLENIVFDSNVRIGGLMVNSMKTSDSKNWFGAQPPDMTLQTQLRGGPEWIYTYLQTFYADPSRPLGVNNLVFENVGMPHAMLELQGMQEMVCKQIPKLAANGGDMRDPLSGEPITEEKCGKDLIDRGYSPLQVVEGSGSLTAEEYEKVVYDLSNFLYYVGEPTRLERERIGYFVLLFLAFFSVFTWLLNREYWKDVH